MGHHDLIPIFERLFPTRLGTAIYVWFPNGKNSIRLGMKDKREFIFTYHDEAHWQLETLDNFINRLKGEKVS